MLALILACSISAGGVRAQNNPEYNFQQQSLPDGTSYATTDLVPVLTMDCLAANGYGQWTLSSKWGGNANSGIYTPGWYLLENALREPSESTPPGCQPPGVVDYGEHVTTGYTPTGNSCMGGSYNAHAPAGPKAATNLDGWTCFVWVDATNQQFDVEFFSPADIDISLQGLPTNTHIVTSPPSPQTIHATPIPIPNTVVSETDPRDDFDIAMDAKFLYITWCTGSPKQIWVTAVQLSTLTFTPVAGFPMQVGSSPNGQYPTIACSARNNRVGSTPSFVVGYLTSVGGSPAAKSWNGSAWTSYNFSASTCTDPSTGSPDNYGDVLHVRAVASDVLNQTIVTYGLYLIATVVPVLPSGQSLLLYPNLLPSASLVANYCDGRILGPNTMLLNTHPTPPQVHDESMTAFCDPYDNQSTFDGFHCVYRMDAQFSTVRIPLMIMRGIDNGALGTTDTRLLLTQTGGMSSVLEDDPAVGTGWLIPYCAAVNQMGIHVHWRTAAAVHFYARDMSRTFDEPIDENTLVTDLCIVGDGTAHGGLPGATILPGKKVTIWSDPNYANNGFYQPPVPGATTLTPNPGTLSFVDPNITLLVGDGTASSNATLAVMPNFQLIFQGYPDGDQTYSSQGVTVQAGAIFNYYGVSYNYYTPTTGPNAGITTATFVSEISNADPDEYFDGAGTISLLGTQASPSTLNIYPGANMDILEDEFLLSGPNVPLSPNINLANINILYGNSIQLPQTDDHSGRSGYISGVLTIEGEGVLDNTTVTSQVPSGSVYVPSQSNPTHFSFMNYPIYVPCPKSTDGLGMGNINGSDEINDPPFQLTATNSIFLNNYPNSSSGTGIIRFDGNHIDQSGNLFAYNGVLFSGCTLSNYAIQAINPMPNIGNDLNGIPIVLTNDFSIQGCTFEGWRQTNSNLTLSRTIDIEHSELQDALHNLNNDYGTVNIGGVTGNTFDGNNASGTNASGTTDVFISGFNTTTFNDGIGNGGTALAALQ